MESPLPTEITSLPEPTGADREAILRPLLAFNEASAGSSKYQPVAVMLRDSTTGEASGGLWGHIYYDWLFVELLFVPDNLRGKDFGGRLLAQAEEVAQQKGCIGVWLDTFSFQAPGFYLKQGYELFGTLDDYPKGRQRYFFRKLLKSAGCVAEHSLAANSCGSSAKHKQQ